MATRLSKSRFVAGAQCLKRLYFQVHRSELAAPAEDAVQAIMEQGNEVGTVARRAFPGGVLVEGSHEDLYSAVQTTRELVANDSVPAIFEATFAVDDILVRVDVLDRKDAAGFRLIEVKSATSVKDPYRYDVGIQGHVMRKAGVPIGGTYLMHLNRQYVYGGGDYDLSQLFTLADLSANAVPDEKICGLVKEQFTILGQPEPPQVKPGDQVYRSGDVRVLRALQSRGNHGTTSAICLVYGREKSTNLKRWRSRPLTRSQTTSRLPNARKQCGLA